MFSLDNVLTTCGLRRGRPRKKKLLKKLLHEEEFQICRSPSPPERA